MRAGVAKRERLLRAKRAEKGKAVLGPEVVLATDWTTKPPKKHRLKPKLRPALACKNKDLRIKELARLKGFRVAYRETLKRYKNCTTGAARDKIVFPAGTYQLRALGVRCAPFG